jgi:hypothetical protein
VQASEAAVDPVEAALLTALTAASAAGVWAAVEALTKELAARRRARKAETAPRGQGSEVSDQTNGR